MLAHATVFSQLNDIAPEGLPVRIASLHGSRYPDEVRLTWTVGCELPYARFAIQRSANATDFETIGSFDADQVRCRSPFYFSDQNVVGAEYYRVAVGDIDGNFSTEKILHIPARPLSQTTVEAANPLWGNTVKLTITAKADAVISLNIMDVSGRIVKKEKIAVAKGITVMGVFMGNLPPGVYWLKFYGKNSAGYSRVVKY